MTIADAVLVQAAGIIFTTGVFVNKINTLTAHVKKLENLPERLAKAETEIQNLKEQLQ